MKRFWQNVKVGLLLLCVGISALILVALIVMGMLAECGVRWVIHP